MNKEYLCSLLNDRSILTAVRTLFIFDRVFREKNIYNYKPMWDIVPYIGLLKNWDIKGLRKKYE